MLLDARGNLVVNADTGGGHVVGLAGVSDLVVVHTPDATLVTSLTAAEKVKSLVAAVAEAAGPRFV